MNNGSARFWHIDHVCDNVFGHMVPVAHDYRDLRDSTCIDVHSYLKLECLSGEFPGI